MDFIHIDVIPEENAKLRETITSPGLKGSTIEVAWRCTLREPEKYFMIDPKVFLEPVKHYQDTMSFLNYLQTRYW